MSVNNHLWNDVDVRNHCFERMQELYKEEPVNEAAIKRYSDDLVTAAMGTRAFTVSTCEMLKDRIRTKLVLLQELRGTNLESETPVYVTETVRAAENFCKSHNQEGDVAGKTAETVGKRAEKILKQMDEMEFLLNMTMQGQSAMVKAKALEQNVMEREKALKVTEKALSDKVMEAEKTLKARESALAAKAKALLTRVLKDENGQSRSKILALLTRVLKDEDGQSRSKFFDERTNKHASQFPVLSSEPRSSILTSPPISERSEVGSPQLPVLRLEPRSSQGQLRSKIFDERDLLSRNPTNQMNARSETEMEGIERPWSLQAFDNGLLSDEDGQSPQFPVLSSDPRSSQGQLRSKILSPPISECSDVGPPPIMDNDMIDPKKDDTQMAECLNELKSGKTFRNPTSCHTSVDNAVPVEIGTLSLAQTSISETVIDTDFPVGVLIGSPFLAQLEGTTERDRRVPEKIDDTFYKDARTSMRKDIVIVADGGIGGDVSTSTVPSWRTTQAQQIEFSVEPGHPKCWMQSKDSWKSSMPQYTGLQSASQASQYERLHQAGSPSHSILQFRPEGFILPNPAKNPNRFPFERKLLEEYTRRMFAAQQLEPSTSPVASRSHAIAKPVSFKQQDACIDRGKVPFKLDRYPHAVNTAIQLMSFMGMFIAQALQIIGRHLWCRLLQQWSICQALPCTPDETFPPGRYNFLTTSKSFKATRDQGPSSSSKLLCYWGIELAI